MKKQIMDPSRKNVRRKICLSAALVLMLILPMPAPGPAGSSGDRGPSLLPKARTARADGAADDAMDPYDWCRTWVRIGEEETFLAVTLDEEHNLHILAHFEHMPDFECVVDSYDRRDLDFSEPGGLIGGHLTLAPEAGRLYMTVGEENVKADRDSALYGYFTKGTFIFTDGSLPSGDPEEDDASRDPYGDRDGGLPGDEKDIPAGERAVRLFEALSGVPLQASSGAGAWEGRLWVGSDGTFTGYYYDEDHNAIHEVSFSGAFAPYAEAVGSTYLLWVDRISTERVPGTEAMSEYGIPVIYDGAPLEESSCMVLTLPGTPADDIPEAVRAEIGGTFGEWEDFSAFYTLTRADDGWGFFADASQNGPDDLEPVPTLPPVTPGPTDAAPAGEPDKPPVSGDGDGSPVAWTGVWRCAGEDAEILLSIFRQEGEEGDYGAVLTVEKDGSLPGIAGTLYFVDEITMDLYSEGCLHAGLVLSPEAHTISLTVFNVMEEALMPFVKDIEADYGYAGHVWGR